MFKIQIDQYKPIIGLTIDQICIGANELVINIDSDYRVIASGKVETVVNGIVSLGPGDAWLLAGRTVTDVRIVSLRCLEIEMDHSFMIRLWQDGGEFYESIVLYLDGSAISVA